jgi:multicomponent Na+:H+ antiporter subunit G
MMIVIAILMILGLFFCAVGVIGILRMPDAYTRMQASTCIATLGTICIGLAGVIYAAWQGQGAGMIVKIVLFTLFVVITNPVSGHALAKAAHKMGVKPAKRFVMDDYKEDDVR